MVTLAFKRQRAHHHAENDQDDQLESDSSRLSSERCGSSDRLIGDKV